MGADIRDACPRRISAEIADHRPDGRAGIGGQDGETRAHPAEQSRHALRHACDVAKPLRLGHHKRVEASRREKARRTGAIDRVPGHRRLPSPKLGAQAHSPRAEHRHAGAVRGGSPSMSISPEPIIQSMWMRLLLPPCAAICSGVSVAPSRKHLE